ncbi:MAG: hypothetical protein U0984_12010 [Prosthecobacter sp.]|nr:hypothetical protein [Prosthecobacter sp.]
MNSSAPTKNDTADFALSVAAPALLAGILMAALFYLGGYSMGKDFADKAPQWNQAFIADNANR